MNSKKIHKQYKCGNKTFTSNREEDIKYSKYIGDSETLTELGTGGYASACEINNDKILRVVTKTEDCDTECLKKEFYNVKLMEDFNKQTNNEYAPNVHSNYIDCDLKVCINPTFSYSIQEKYDHDLFDYFEDRRNTPGVIDTDMVSQIIKIIDILHKKNIFHRDIKKENLLIKEVLQRKKTIKKKTSKKNIKKFLKIAITDFGLSTFIEKGKLKTTKLEFVAWVQPPFLKYKYHLINIISEEEKIKFLTYLDWWATIMVLLNIDFTDNDEKIYQAIKKIDKKTKLSLNHGSTNLNDILTTNIIKFYNAIDSSLRQLVRTSPPPELDDIDIQTHIYEILENRWGFG